MALLDESSDTIAELLFVETMLGGPDSDEQDPAMILFYWHTRQYMHGVCTTLAMHLMETRGLPVILLEARPRGETRWQLRHAAVCASTEKLSLADHDDGYGIPIIDAAGGGAFGDRVELYGISDWDMRVIYASDTDNAMNRLMGSPRETTVDIEDDALALPGLCQALGIEFDARRSLGWIVDNLGSGSGVADDIIEAARAARSPVSVI